MGGTAAGEEAAAPPGARVLPLAALSRRFLPWSQPLLDELLQLADAGGLLLGGGGAEGQGGAAVAS